MDGIANVARQQQSQVSTPEAHGRAAEQSAKTQPTHSTPTKQPDLVKEIQQETKTSSSKLNSEKDIQELVKQLNQALDPMNTSLRFGVDSQDIFYVSVIDSQTDKMIRRFPAEQAQDFLPKMQEVTGILFDSKG